MAAATKSARDLFLAALERSPAERSAYLEEACAGDAALRQRVEALLEAHDEPGAFLSEAKPPAAGDAPGALADSEAGTVVAGRYTLLQRIGEGGMGEVWVAKQTEPVKRKVALKLIKAGMDTKAVLQRFEAERQALALMDHPNIARVLDGGMTADRRPFFIMELVNGLPLTRFCDEAKLGIRERLELFAAICQAVQHAHQKGIIHRDLKPSNILVTLIDGQPVPKVIDFGVAKAIGGKLLDESLSTQFGAVVGTLEYMAPEQAGYSGSDIDTRADIYSLGVILYELLTGLRPIDAKRLKQAALNEMIRILREEEPSKPSTRLSTDEALPSLAASRDIEPKKLMALLRGELDWVVMKCLEKQRERRYETASGLARDIQRYLADEPVEARPPSAGYRLHKFLKRNKGSVLAASLVLFALLAGIIGTTWGLFEARRQENEAKKQEKLAREETADKEKALRAEAERADERDKANNELKHRLGVSDMVLAVAAYDNGDVRLAAERLDKVPAEQRGWEWRYLKQQTRGGLFTLYGHMNRVSCVAFSPDGTRIVTGGGEQQNKSGEAKVWDARTGSLLLDLRGLPPVGAHSHVLSVSFSPDGTRIVTGGGEENKPGEAKVWDARTGTVLLELKGEVGPVLCASFSPDGTRIVTGGSGTVKVWDARTGKVLLDLKGHKYGVTSVSFSPDGTRIVTGSMDQTVKVWDAQKGGTPLLDLKGITSGESTVSFSPDGTRIVTGRRDGRDWTATVVDAKTGAVLLELKGRMRGADAETLDPSGVLSVSYSPDGTRIVTAGGVYGSGEAKVWDARTGKALLELKGHTDMVMSAAFSPDGTRIVTGSMDLTVKVWDARTGTPHLELNGDRDDVLGVAFSPDGTRIVTADGVFEKPFEMERKARTPSKATVWDAQTGKALFALKAPKGTVKCVAFSRDGTRIVTGGVAFQKPGEHMGNLVSVGAATIWDAQTGKALLDLKGFKEGVNSVAFSPDGTRIITGAIQDGDEGGTEVKVWDARTGAVLLDLTDPPMAGGVFLNLRGGSVAFSPDGTRILIAGIREKKSWRGHTAKVCDARTGAVLVELKGEVGPVLSASFSPDGTRIVTGGWGTVKVWDARTGAAVEPFELKGHTGHVNGVAFNRDGTRIVTGSGDRTVRVWDARTGTTLVELKGLTGAVVSVAFSPDGTRIVTGGCGDRGRPGEVMVWDARIVTAPRELKGHTDHIASASFSPDGTRFVTGSYDRTVKVWDTRTGTALLDLKGFTDDMQFLQSVAFSPDGTRIFARMHDEFGKAWDARTGQELQGEVIPRTLPNERTSPDGCLFAYVREKRVELVTLKPDAEELDYRRLHTQSNPWRYREGYLAARAAKDDFAARFYLELIPLADRPGVVARADVNALAPLSKRAEAHSQAGEWDQALPLLVEIANVTKTRLGPEEPETLEAMIQLGGLYRQMGQLDKSIPVFEEVLKVRAAKLGRGHMDTLMTMQTLGENYKAADRLKEAIPLLEEVHRAMVWNVDPLLDAYLKAGEKAKLSKLIQELVASARKTPPPDSSELARFLEYISLLLLQSKAYTEADPLLRECLALREKTEPDAWPTFHTRSLLGEALLGQKKYADAEPLLLSSYEGMKQREKTVPPPDQISAAIERLVQLYEAMDRKDDAARWRKELEARKKE